jgi:hypothetical protein
MIEYVTLTEASDHLRRDTTDDDNDLSLKIKGASAAVRNYLKQEWRAYVLALDSNGDVVVDSNGNPVPEEDSNGPILRPEVKVATLQMIGEMYKYREGEQTGRINEGYGYLPIAVVALLYPLRKPVAV